VDAAALRRRAAEPRQGGPGLLQRLLIKDLNPTERDGGRGPGNLLLIGQIEKVLAQVFVAEQYGRGRWRKVKGIAKVRLPRGTIRLAETHWYEAHGIGKKEFKLKMPFLD